MAVPSSLSRNSEPVPLASVSFVLYRLTHLSPSALTYIGAIPNRGPRIDGFTFTFNGYLSNRIGDDSRSVSHGSHRTWTSLFYRGSTWNLRCLRALAWFFFFDPGNFIPTPALKPTNDPCVTVLSSCGLLARFFVE